MALPRWLTRPSPLAWRIYIIGLVQFALVAALMEANRRASQHQPPWERHTHYVAATLGRHWDDPDEVAKETQRAAEAFGWKVDLRGPDGAVVVHAEPTNHPPYEARAPRGSVPITLPDGRVAHFDYVVGPPPFSSSRSGLPFGLGVPTLLVLVVVGLTSVIAARSLATPLGDLAEVARRFGSGKLDARAKMKRSDEIGDVARAFDEMADRITSLLLAERELLANVSHELRTPLARIRVALDLANEAEPKVAVESLGEIAQDLAELERIVDDVLASARLALGAGESMVDSTLPLRAQDVDVKELLERSVGKLASQHPTRTLRTKIANDLPIVSGDPVLLRRLIDNLLDNAHKYTEDASSPIELVARAEKDSVVVEVRDRGIGIAKEDLARLFEPFFRADRSRTRATGGLGLGLALSRRVVDAHKGTLVFESELGKGTVARVRLPADGGRPRVHP